MEDKKIVVKWLDAKIFPGMHSMESALRCKLDVFESLGYLIQKDDKATVVAHEITGSGEYRDVLLIPSGSVISIHELITSSSV